MHPGMLALDNNNNNNNNDNNILYIVNNSPMKHKKILQDELEGFGIRINKKPPKVRIKKLDKGPVNVIKIEKQTHLDDKTIQQICKSYKYNSAEVILREDITMDILIDVLEGNRVYIPMIYVLNMIDKISIEELNMVARINKVVPISAKKQWNIDGLLDRVWKELKMLRIYTKPKGQIPDLNDPVILPKGGNTIEDFCNKIHKTLAKQMEYAWVWGTSTKFNPQKVGKSHKLHDEDVVQIVKKK